MLKRIMFVLTLAFCCALFADYVEGRADAVNLKNKRKYAEALEAFTKLAQGDVSDFQKADALEQAADCARALKKYDLAGELVKQIPLEPVAKTVEMQTLVSQRKYKELVEKFKDENIDAWPFWKAGEAFYARGTALYAAGEGKAAEEDLRKATELVTDRIENAHVLTTLGRNRSKNLKDENAALEAYREVLAKEGISGNSVYMGAVLSAVAILRDQKRYDEAVAALNKVSLHKMRGYWHGALLTSLGATLADAGKKDEAIAAYEEILTDDKVHPSHTKAAREALQKLHGAE